MHELGTILTGLNTVTLAGMVIVINRYWVNHSEVLERISNLEGKMDLLIEREK